jgi:hypothetical protein
MKTIRPHTARRPWLYARIFHPVAISPLGWLKAAYCSRSNLHRIEYPIHLKPPAHSERGRIDYAFLLFLLFVLAILFFVAYDFLPVAARVPSAEIPAANFELFNHYIHLW